jgi:hypothetical protein
MANDLKISDRSMRAAIEEMITQDGYCIQSSENGYRLIKNELMLNDAIKYLKAKAFPLLKRAQHLQRNFVDVRQGQLSFLEEI